MQLTLTINYEATKMRLMEIINSVPYGNADALADKLIQNEVFFLSEDTLKEFIQQAALNLLISAEANKASYLKVEEPNDTAQLQALWRTLARVFTQTNKLSGVTLKNQEEK